MALFRAIMKEKVSNFLCDLFSGEKNDKWDTFKAKARYHKRHNVIY